MTPSRALADLHRHLDGSLRRATLEQLAEGAGIPIPDRLEFRAGMGLAEALALFEVTLSVLQSPEAVRRVASEICEDAIAEGVTTLEIRFAPQLHRGAPLDDILDAACAGSGGRAGLILCGLYGESPSVLESLVEASKPRPTVVGIDLAGGPSPEHRVRLEDYQDAYREARAAGLGCTVHAGEGRPASEIRAAIEALGATRIGHATTLLDDPELVDLVVERGVVIEACLTSNLHTGAIARLSEHPLPRWLARGVRACICTDNTLLSKVDARDELRRAEGLPGMSSALIAAAIANGHVGAFVRGERPPVSR